MGVDIFFFFFFFLALDVFLVFMVRVNHADFQKEIKQHRTLVFMQYFMLTSKKHVFCCLFFSPFLLQVVMTIHVVARKQGESFKTNASCEMRR